MSIFLSFEFMIFRWQWFENHFLSESHDYDRLYICALFWVGFQASFPSWTIDFCCPYAWCQMSRKWSQMFLISFADFVSILVRFIAASIFSEKWAIFPPKRSLKNGTKTPSCSAVMNICDVVRHIFCLSAGVSSRHKAFRTQNGIHKNKACRHYTTTAKDHFVRK